ncbi:hypothetical protein GCK72_003339 [Caenorhabditis remanei]|uniref:Uncharacterized protein n=1 Tax=Caenorhabditis remanei TaxID=31234 RepID=A0A6A5HYS7_CAERE|nr:hypothetical protein GCK72_003339 [Caenorhabditis remanei]KAF1771512.1 hypothetical protein GCK72_003339 [Caenorhabditis remanei]
MDLDMGVGGCDKMFERRIRSQPPNGQGEAAVEEERCSMGGTHDAEHLKKMYLIDYQIVVWHFDNHHRNIEPQRFVGLYF